MVEADVDVWEDDSFALSEETAGVVGNRLSGDAGWPARVTELPLDEDAPVLPNGPKEYDVCLSFESKLNKLPSRALYDNQRSPGEINFLCSDDPPVIVVASPPEGVGLAVLHGELALALGARPVAAAGESPPDGAGLTALDGERGVRTRAGVDDVLREAALDVSVNC